MSVIPTDYTKEEYNKAEEFIKIHIQDHLLYAQKVCSVRRAEGYYINETLRQMRDAIKQSIIAKGGDMLYNSPDFISQCISDYCPDTEYKCFKLPKKKDKMEIDSIIFKNIYANLQEIYNLSSETYTVEEFYKNILVGIFCVLNISTGANNPPPVPYVDINDLKKAYFNKQAREIKTPFTDIVHRINKINHPKPTQPDEKPPPTLLDINIKNPHANVMFNSLTNDVMTQLNKSTLTFKNLHESTDMSKLIEKIISEIDNHNAATAIGTLEFTDSIAKYNTVHNTCVIRDPQMKQIIENQNLQLVVNKQNFGGSSKTKRNKKKRNNKTRKVK